MITTPAAPPVHIMIDLETMGTTPGCPVLSIGAVAFDADGVKDDPFYSAIKLAENPTVAASTLLWWLNQSEEARHVLIDDQKSAESAEHTLKLFASWVGQTLRGKRLSGVWANGASFDLPIIEHAMREVGVEVPWLFYQRRCFRTMKSLPGASDAVGLRPEFGGTAHSALDDAIHQAAWLINIHYKITPCL